MDSRLSPIFPKFNCQVAGPHKFWVQPTCARQTGPRHSVLAEKQPGPPNKTIAKTGVPNKTESPQIDRISGKNPQEIKGLTGKIKAIYMYVHVKIHVNFLIHCITAQKKTKKKGDDHQVKLQKQV
jgi:hypothetical protein